MSDKIIVESSDKNDSPVEIEEKLEKAYNSIALQREKKQFTDNYLKNKKDMADKVVEKVFQNMIDEIVKILL